MKLAIVDVLGSPYDGDTLNHRGLGGSESAVISISRELVKLGINVDVWNDCASLDAKPGVYDGVVYRDRNTIIAYTLQYDVVISSRSVFGFRNNNLITNKRILWMHDTFCDGDQLLERMVVSGEIDEVWTLSDWHTSYITNCNHGHRRMPEVLKRKIWQTRNGVNLYNSYVDIDKKNRNLYVWNASVSKGLKTLLEDVWPLVRTVNPVAELTVIGGYYELNQPDEQQKLYKELYNHYHDLDGIQFTGIITQKQVSLLLENASYFLYPQSLPETFGISTLEALAHGVTPITGRFGALEEIAIEDASYLMDYPVDSNALYSFDKQAHLREFEKLIWSANDDEYLWKQKANKALIVREVSTWDKVALQWKQHLFKITGRYLDSVEEWYAQQDARRWREIFNTRWSNPEERSPSERSIGRTIHVIVPFRNAEDYIYKCIDSIAAQRYNDYQVWLIDDASDDPTAVDRIRDYIFNKMHTEFDISRNSVSIGALANQMSVIKSLEKHFAIVVLIDGDDCLENDPYIFNKIDRLYSQGAEFTYGSCWSVIDNIPLIAQEYPPEVKKNKSYREHKFAWNIPYTHLRTFSTSAIPKLDDSLLRDGDGRYYRAGGDSALFYALLDVVSPDRIVAVKDVWYRYNDASPSCDYRVNSLEQTKNSHQIIAKGSARKDKKRILIAIPTAQNIRPETFKSIYDLEVPDGYETEFQFFYGYCIDQVRNLIADWVIKDFDYLFAVDYDMEFSSDTLKQLLSHDRDIVSGLYRQRKSEVIYEAYSIAKRGEHSNYGPFTLPTNLSEVAGVGFGCVLVKKRVFAEVGYPQFVYHHAIEMHDTVSEDIDFCTKARAKGFKIWLDPNVKCRHHGSTTFDV